jgi:hypothetical protein
MKHFLWKPLSGTNRFREFELLEVGCGAAGLADFKMPRGRVNSSRLRKLSGVEQSESAAENNAKGC